MPELRQDPTTKEWVVIATERAKRPDQFTRPRGSAQRQTEASRCVLCPGGESLTPAEVFAIRDHSRANEPGWRVRVVPNKFPAFMPEGRPGHRQGGPLFNVADACGHHEVIIETADHDWDLGQMNRGEIEDVLHAWQQRYQALRSDPRIKLVLVFRNHGAKAGTSLQHPHSQLVAAPVVPLLIRQKYEVAIRHFDDTNRCLYCDVLAAELAEGRRVVLETGCFGVVHPFASQVPFQTWILPKRHNPSFGAITAEERKDLATVLGRVLRALRERLDDPDYNLIVHTAPVEDEQKPYYLWHIEIRPRLTTAAGFELGTGIFINTAVPEQTAPFMRSLLTAPGGAS